VWRVFILLSPLRIHILICILGVVRCISYSECKKREFSLSLLLFIFLLNTPWRGGDKNLQGFGIKWTHQIMVCADKVNSFGKTISTIKKGTEVLLDARKNFFK
jgi:hypothetical protein